MSVQENKMDTIYVISKIESDYDSYNSQPVLVTPKLEIAEEFVKKMTIRASDAQLTRQEIEQHITKWELTEKRPLIGQSKQIPLPHFSGRKNTWTKEQKALYDKVKEENRQNAYNAHNPFTEWVNQRVAEIEIFKKANYSADELDDIQFLGNDSSWQIETVNYSE